MIRHIVMFNWKPETDEDTPSKVEQGFMHMRDTIKEVVSMQCGADLSLADGNFDYAMIADFASVEDWQAYRDHPKHIAFVQEFGALAKEAARIQIEI